MRNLTKTSLFNATKEVSWVFVGQALALIGSLVLVKVLTSYLNPETYGLLALSLTSVGLFSQILMNSISAAVGRFLPVAKANNQIHLFAKASIKMLIASSFVGLFLGLIIFIILISLDHLSWAWLGLLGFILATLTFYNFTVNTIQNAARNRKIVALHTVLETWLKILLSVAVIYFFGATANSALIGYIIALCFVLISQKIFIKKILGPEDNQSSNAHKDLSDKSTNWFFNIWLYAWPFASWGFFTWAQQVSDIWSLKFFSTTAEVGLYTVAFQLGFAPIVLINGVVLLYLGPILNQKINQIFDINNNRYVHTVTWVTVIASMILTSIFFSITYIYSEQIFTILVSNTFQAASVYFPWLILAGGFFSAGQILSLKLMSEFKTQKMIGVKICTALLGLALNILGAYTFGMKGVVGSMILFSFTYFIWMVWLTWRSPQNPTS